MHVCSDNSWEPRANLGEAAQQLLVDFERERPSPRDISGRMEPHPIPVLRFDEGAVAPHAFEYHCVSFCQHCPFFQDDAGLSSVV